MLTVQQQVFLKTAANTHTKDSPARIEEIDKVTKMLKRMSPELFYHDTVSKPDPKMRKRKFFDQPDTMRPEMYDTHVVDMTSGLERNKLFAGRDLKALRKGTNLK